MENECLICGAPLEYCTQEINMECSLCHKKEASRTRCVKGHYVCNECHTQGIDRTIELCKKEQSSDPILILNHLMAQPFCHMHGPEHHVLVGAALLTAARNAGAELDLVPALMQITKRGREVPGGACGFWGACGAGISTGIYISVLTNSTPLSKEPFGLANRMTAKALERIGQVGGPRCCKRDSYLSVLAAIEFTAEHIGISMDRTEIRCAYSAKNNQCIGSNCPFSAGKGTGEKGGAAQEQATIDI